MKFGEVALSDASGAILAHKLYDDAGRLVLNKGHSLSPSDVRRLQGLGYERITVCRLEPGDLHEDAAARRIGRALQGAGIAMRAPGVGRANLTASQRGLLHVDVPALHGINSIADGITVATLRSYSLVEAGELLALVKVVPFAVPEARVVDVERSAAGTPLLQLRPLQAQQVALIITSTESTRDRLHRQFHLPVRRRIEGWGSRLAEPLFAAHTADAIADAIRACAGADLVLIASMSAIIDTADVVPSALQRAGGSMTLHGLPVDPGTLLMLGYLGEQPVVGMPGCVRSPKTNVIDWVLPRLLSGERLTRAQLLAMGHGGLLKDIAERPMPRSKTAN